MDKAFEANARLTFQTIANELDLGPEFVENMMSLVGAYLCSKPEEEAVTIVLTRNEACVARDILRDELEMRIDAGVGAGCVAANLSAMVAKFEEALQEKEALPE